MSGKRGFGNHVCYGTDWTWCGSKKGGVAKINGGEPAMKWKLKNLS